MAQFQGHRFSGEDAPPLTHPAVSSFYEALPLMFPRFVGREDRYIVSLYGYFDESGTHDPSPAVTLAGFLAPADEWGAFIVRWEAVLKKWELPYFHMADFENRLGFYEHWTDAMRRDRLNKLLEIIGDHCSATVGVSFRRSDYEAIFPKNEDPGEPNPQWLAPGILSPYGDDQPPTGKPKRGDIRRKSGGPYGLAATFLIADVANVVRPLPGEPYVNYTFEKGANGQGQVQRIYMDQINREDARRTFRTGSIAFADKREFLPLQAADIVAYELYKELPQQMGRDEPTDEKPHVRDRPTRYPLRAIGKRFPKERRSWTWADPRNLRETHEVIRLGLHHSRSKALR